MARISVTDEMMAVMVGFVPTPISYVKVSNVESWSGKRRIQVAVLRAR